MAAPVLGKTGPEMDKGGGASKEIDALWLAIKQMVKAANVR
jgi:hypothetical protein